VIAGVVVLLYVVCRVNLSSANCWRRRWMSSVEVDRLSAVHRLGSKLQRPAVHLMLIKSLG